MQQASEWARQMVDMASDRHATDVLLLDVRDLNTFTDFFLIMSAESRRQTRTLVRDITRELNRRGVRMHRWEGTTDSGWVLLDCGDVVIHIFAPEERAYYRLEDVWVQGRPIIRVQ